MTFLSREEYFADIIDAINRAGKGDDIRLATMSFDRGDNCTALVSAMLKASKSGAKVHFAADTYNYLIDKTTWKPGPLFWHKTLPKQLKEPFKSFHDNLTKLSTAGVNITLLNPGPKLLSNPFSGRSHIKYCLINDTSYIGGCNLSSSVHIDIMIKSNNKTLAQTLRQFSQKITAEPTVKKALKHKDQTIKINKDLDLLIDAGVKKQSIIYDQALHLIDSAKEYIFMTSQYPPHGATAHRLARATKRGVNVRLLYNSPVKHHGYIKLLLSVTKKYYQIILPKELFKNELPEDNLYIHSKALLSDTGAMFGSHNFATAGVKFGTAEFCLQFGTPRYNDQIIKTIENQLNL